MAPGHAARVADQHDRHAHQARSGHVDLARHGEVRLEEALRPLPREVRVAEHHAPPAAGALPPQAVGVRADARRRSLGSARAASRPGRGPAPAAAPPRCRRWPRPSWPAAPAGRSGGRRRSPRSAAPTACRGRSGRGCGRRPCRAASGCSRARSRAPPSRTSGRGPFGGACASSPSTVRRVDDALEEEVAVEVVHARAVALEAVARRPGRRSASAPRARSRRCRPSCRRSPGPARSRSRSRAPRTSARGCAVSRRTVVRIDGGEPALAAQRLHRSARPERAPRDDRRHEAATASSSALPLRIAAANVPPRLPVLRRRRARRHERDRGAQAGLAPQRARCGGRAARRRAARPGARRAAPRSCRGPRPGTRCPHSRAGPSGSLADAACPAGASHHLEDHLGHPEERLALAPRPASAPRAGAGSRGRRRAAPPTCGRGRA